jgi:hypothetical protein
MRRYDDSDAAPLLLAVSARPRASAKTRDYDGHRTTQTPHGGSPRIPSGGSPSAREHTSTRALNPLYPPDTRRPRNTPKRCVVTAHGVLAESARRAARKVRQSMAGNAERCLPNKTLAMIPASSSTGAPLAYAPPRARASYLPVRRLPRIRRPRSHTWQYLDARPIICSDMYSGRH